MGGDRCMPRTRVVALWVAVLVVVSLGLRVVSQEILLPQLFTSGGGAPSMDALVASELSAVASSMWRMRLTHTSSGKLWYGWSYVSYGDFVARHGRDLEALRCGSATGPQFKGHFNVTSTRV